EPYLNRSKAEEKLDPQSSAATAPFELGSRHAFSLLSLAFEHTSHPEVAAVLICDALISSACVVRLRLDDCDTGKTLREFHREAGNQKVGEERVFDIPQDGTQHLRLTLVPQPGPDSQFTLAAVKLLVDKVRELRIAQAERERRTVLWPLDELPNNGTNAVVS